MGESREPRRIWWAAAVAAVVVLAVLAVQAIPDGRVTGVVTQNGRPVAGARVVLTLHYPGQRLPGESPPDVISIPFIRPAERMVRTDGQGRYVFEHARTDAPLGIFALPPTGPGGELVAEVRPAPGTTVTMDLQLPVRGGSVPGR